MKAIQKYFCLILCTILLSSVAFFTSTKEDVSLPYFLTQNSGGSNIERISIFDAQDGNYYVFLPAYAQMEHTTIQFEEEHSFSLDNIDLHSGMTCATFRTETPYSFTIDGKNVAALWFYRSANVPAVYIDTATGGMDYIHQDKTHEEDAQITIYTADGNLHYHSAQSSLKGRGNATWTYDKRPYTLTLSEEAPLLGMTPGTTWILLANAKDETNLNNYIVHTMGARSGLEWSPACRWADIWLNGEYSGLYLITEKVEIGQNRLNLDSASGDFLCKLDFQERFSTLNQPFLTAQGRTVEISSPDHADSNHIITQVNQLEALILSDSDLSTEDIFDLDSWVRRYLIDEISANIDSDMASSYFYCRDGVFYAGPIWDYDMTFGNIHRNREPNSFIAKNAMKSETWTSPYYDALYQNESFHNRMVEIYAQEFLPVLEEMIAFEIPQLVEHIGPASAMNSLRWRSMYDYLRSMTPNCVYTPDALLAYLQSRTAFLNDAWINGTEYCTVQIEPSPGVTYWNISVPKGSRVETTFIDLENIVLFHAETGEVFNADMPVTTDLILVREPVEAPESDGFSTSDYVVFLSIAALVAMMTGFAIIDCLRRRREGRIGA